MQVFTLIIFNKYFYLILYAILLYITYIFITLINTPKNKDCNTMKYKNTQLYPETHAMLSDIQKVRRESSIRKQSLAEIAHDLISKSAKKELSDG